MQICNLRLVNDVKQDQKEAIEKGVITMQDVEMAVADAADGKLFTAVADSPDLVFKQRVRTRSILLMSFCVCARA